MSYLTKNETGNRIDMPCLPCLEKRLAIFNNSTYTDNNSKVGELKQHVSQ